MRTVPICGIWKKVMYVFHYLPSSIFTCRLVCSFDMYELNNVQYRDVSWASFVLAYLRWVSRTGFGMYDTICVSDGLGMKSLDASSDYW